MTVSASLVARAEAQSVGDGNSGLARQPLGAIIVIGRVSPWFTGMWHMHGSIQQHGADGQPDGDVDRAFQGHIDRAVAHLVCRAGQIDRDLIAGHGYGSLNRQIAPLRLRVIQKSVDHGRSAVGPVRQPGNRLAHQALGIVHDGVAGGLKGLQAVLAYQVL